MALTVLYNNSLRTKPKQVEAELIFEIGIDRKRRPAVGNKFIIKPEAETAYTANNYNLRTIPLVHASLFPLERALIIQGPFPTSVISTA